jgi:hypothetical protein
MPENERHRRGDRLRVPPVLTGLAKNGRLEPMVSALVAGIAALLLSTAGCRAR